MLYIHIRVCTELIKLEMEIETTCLPFVRFDNSIIVEIF